MPPRRCGRCGPPMTHTGQQPSYLCPDAIMSAFRCACGQTVLQKHPTPPPGCHACGPAMTPGPVGGSPAWPTREWTCPAGHVLVAPESPLPTG